MHDSQTLAFSIKSPFKNSKGECPTLIDIWHVDPETDGSDDSCGWSFPKPDKGVTAKVRREFEAYYSDYFDQMGKPLLSPIGMLVNLYRSALWQIFSHQNVKDQRKATNKYMRKHLYDIINFAENPVDSLFDALTGKRHQGKKEEFCSDMAHVIVRDIYRHLRPWYMHPRWHVHHWKINFVWWRTNVVRRFWTKCSVCGRRGGFVKGGVVDWSGKNLRHRECDLNSRTKQTASHESQP